MGKASILAVIAIAALTYATSGYTIKRNTFESEKLQSTHEEKVLAREIAKSAMNAALSSVRRDFDTFREDTDATNLNGGSFDMGVSGAAAGPADLVVIGRYGKAKHTIRTAVKRLSTLPAAISIDADTAVVTLSGNVAVSGKDTDGSSTSSSVAEGSGQGNAVKAIWARASEVENTIRSSVTQSVLDKLRGQTPSADLNNGPLPINLDALYQEATSNADETFYGDQQFSGSTTFGSPDYPTILHVQGNATFSDAVQGYGMLIVDGDFYTAGNFIWYGLVLVNGVDATVVEQSGSSRVIGGVVVRHTRTMEEIEVETSIDFNINGGAVTPSSDFSAEVKVLGAAISYGGQYDMPVTVGFEIGSDLFDGFGDMTNPDVGNVNDGATHTVYLPSQFDAYSDITIAARSWKMSGTGGWSTHLSADSDDDSPQVKVLRNGDSVPNIDGFLDQGDVADFVAAYIEESTGKIRLADNQAIYLFELGTTNVNGIDADYQDLVVLVTLGAPGQASSETEGAGQSSTETITVASDTALDFRMQDDASVYYSTETLGKLAARLSSMKARAWVHKAEEWSGEDEDE